MLLPHLAQMSWNVLTPLLETSAVSSMWHSMFHLDLPVVEKLLRPVIVYFILVIGLRLAGKRELAQLNPFDLVVLLMLSNTVQNAIIGNDNSITGGFIGAAALLALNWVIVRFARRNRHIQRILEGRPDVLIRDGKLLRDHLDQEMVTRSELAAAAHKQGITSLNDVERCILEPTGNISFIEKRPTEENQRHKELLEVMNRVLGEVNALKAAHAATSGPGPAQ